MASVIPLFPKFSTLSLSHKDLLRKVSKDFPPYSDFNFASLYTWNIDEAIAVATLHSNLIVRFSDYENDEVFLSLLGTHMLKETIGTLFDYCQENRLVQELRLVPKSVVEVFSQNLKKHYVVEEDRDNHDYIMSVKDILDGAIARNKRRAYNRFAREYSSHIGCRNLDLKSVEVIKNINQVISSWKGVKHLSVENKKEFKAIERCLNHVDDLSVDGYGVMVDDSLVAFIIFEIASESTAMLHYGKSSHHLPGAFDYLKVELARYLQKHNVQFMNFEQDLGLEGLRADKTSFRPIEFLKKYTVIQKT